jgi:hypothetical protein
MAARCGESALRAHEKMVPNQHVHRQIPSSVHAYTCSYVMHEVLVTRCDSALAPTKRVFHMIKYCRCRDTHGQILILYMEEVRD